MTHVPTNDNDMWSHDELDAWDPIYMQLRDQGLSEEQADEILDRIEDTILRLIDDGYAESEIHRVIVEADFSDPSVYESLKARLVQLRRQGYLLVES